jgi:hypothetical protein
MACPRLVVAKAVMFFSITPYLAIPSGSSRRSGVGRKRFAGSFHLMVHTVARVLRGESL